ncbi:Aste57867_17016 [Aphanomyces stellatus]|uniref:Aste57867_17016 protein n=1 Tax=Aphanomyces stellatus TaxID=120398 RepID=A0A485LA68_9STRA|nr:hypothetical protein As57867_016958 [Aphanomyces stellatus]VFT93777.1 Aste57867_17016 [Aphanomyces stellatus]
MAASKSRIVLLADPKKEWRDAKLCRFVREAQENPVLTFVKWNHTGVAPRWLAIAGDRLCEVQRINDNRSLFAPGNIVVQDGSLMVVTPMDPLFVLLGQLATWTRNTQFCDLHDVMESSSVKMANRVTRWHADAISRVCDVEGADDLDTMRVRANESKITSWLQTKVARIMDVAAADAAAAPGDQQAFTGAFQRPPEAGQAAASTSTAVTVTPESIEDDTHKARQAAITMLTEYVDSVWIDLLVKSYGLSPSEWYKEKPSDKVAKIGDDIKAKYDVRQSTTATPAKRPAPASSSKASSASKKKPVDTSGMKSIASFFGKK